MPVFASREMSNDTQIKKWEKFRIYKKFLLLDYSFISAFTCSMKDTLQFIREAIFSISMFSSSIAEE